MARCRSIVLVLVSRPWRKSRENSRAISAGLLRLSSNRARSSPIRNPADTPKTRPGRPADAVFGGRPEAFSSVCLFGGHSQFLNWFLVLGRLPALAGDNAFR